MCAALDLPLMKLQRVQLGPVELGKLSPGETRTLRKVEVAALRRAVEGKPKSPQEESST